MPWAKRALCLGTICAVRKTCTTGGSELAPCLKYARTHVHNWHAARGNCSVLIGCLGSFNYACTLPTGQRQMLVVEVSLLVVSVTRAVPPMLTCELHQITDYLNTVRSVPVTMAAQPACMTRMILKVLCVGDGTGVTCISSPSEPLSLCVSACLKSLCKRMMCARAFAGYRRTLRERGQRNEGAHDAYQTGL